MLVRTSLLVQTLKLCAPNAGGRGLIPSQRTRSHIQQLRPSSAKKKKKKAVTCDCKLNAVSFQTSAPPRRPWVESQAGSPSLVDLASNAQGLCCVHRASPSAPPRRLFPSRLCQLFADGSVSINSIISLLLSQSPQQLLLKFTFTTDMDGIWLLSDSQVLPCLLERAQCRGSWNVHWQEPHSEMPLGNHLGLRLGFLTLLSSRFLPCVISKGKASFIL